MAFLATPIRCEDGTDVDLVHEPDKVWSQPSLEICRIEPPLPEARLSQVLLGTLRSVVLFLDCAIQNDATVSYALSSVQALF